MKLKARNSMLFGFLTHNDGAGSSLRYAQKENTL